MLLSLTFINPQPYIMETKSISLEFKDIDPVKRSAVIAHAVYDSVDEVGDISSRGMFAKSWKEYKAVDFLFNHKEDQIVGTVLGLWDDETKAYTEVKFGKWKLGDDVLEMADAKVLRGASFGYVTQRKEYKSIKGQNIRVLKQVIHKETSLLTLRPAHKGAGIVKLVKSLDEMEFKKLTPTEVQSLKQIVNADYDCLRALVELSGRLDVTSDLYTWINYNIARRAEMIGSLREQIKWNSGEMKALSDHIACMESFVNNAKASDETIRTIESELLEAKALLSLHSDTLDTHLAGAQSSSGQGNREAFTKQLILLNLQQQTFPKIKTAQA